MHPAKDKSQLIKSNISKTPESTPMNSLNNSMKHLKKVKKSLKTLARDHSPLYSTKNIALSRSKDPAVKTSTQTPNKREVPANYKIFTIASPNTIEKNSKIQKILPKLAERSKSNININTVNAVLNIPAKELNYLDLNEDLQANTQILSDNSEYKAKTWLENLITVKEWDKNKGSFLGNLKFLTSIVRDVVHRLKSLGKDNEGILIERVWRFSVELIDEHIESVEKGIVKVDELAQNTVKFQSEMESIKQDCENKVKKLEKEIQRVKLDYILAKDPRLITENQRLSRLKPLIESVQIHLITLSDLYRPPDPPAPDSPAQASILTPKFRRKSPVETFGPEILEYVS